MGWAQLRLFHSARRKPHANSLGWQESPGSCSIYRCARQHAQRSITLFANAGACRTHRYAGTDQPERDGRQRNRRVTHFTARHVCRGVCNVTVFIFSSGVNPMIFLSWPLCPATAAQDKHFAEEEAIRENIKIHVDSLKSLLKQTLAKLHGIHTPGTDGAVYARARARGGRSAPSHTRPHRQLRRWLGRCWPIFHH